MKRVLIVEDVALNRDLLVQLLTALTRKHTVDCKRLGNAHGLLAAPPRRHPPAPPAGGHAWLTALAARPALAAARPSGPQPGVARCDWSRGWTGVSGWGRVAPQGYPVGGRLREHPFLRHPDRVHA